MAGPRFTETSVESREGHGGGCGPPAQTCEGDTRTAFRVPQCYSNQMESPLFSLNTARPAAPAQVEVWLGRDYGRSAKIPDVADVSNVARWIDEQSTATANEGLRAGKAAAVAEALALKGLYSNTRHPALRSLVSRARL